MSQAVGGAAAAAEGMDSLVALEITLISAQGLNKSAADSSSSPSVTTTSSGSSWLPSTPNRCGCGGGRHRGAYAVAWIDPSAKLRTRTDLDGGENPTWNEKLLFRVPAGSLAADSSSAVSVEIHAIDLSGWAAHHLLPSSSPSLVGSVRLLVGNHRLLDRPRGTPCFAALGIRRPSGSFHGVLNVATTLLARGAVAHCDLIERPRPAPPPSPATDMTLRERNWGEVEQRRPTKRANVVADADKKKKRRKMKEGSAKENERPGGSPDGGGGVLCGLAMGLPRKIHLSQSDEDLNTLLPSDG